MSTVFCQLDRVEAASIQKQRQQQAARVDQQHSDTYIKTYSLDRARHEEGHGSCRMNNTVVIELVT